MADKYFCLCYILIHYYMIFSQWAENGEDIA